MDKPILEIKNMQANIINNLNINLKAGEVHAIIGMEGSGKKELVQGLTGRLRVDGDIIFKNKNIKFGLSPLRDNNIQFVFANPVFFDEISIAENMSANNFPLKRFTPFIDHRQIEKKCNKILDKLNLDLDSKTKVRELSMKEKKFLYIGKSFIEKSEVVIMHEPTANLDGEFIQELNNFIFEYKNHGGSVLYISRQWEEALKIADRISVLSEGKIIGTQKASDAREDPKKLINMIIGGEVFNNNSELENESSKFLNGVYKAAEFLTSKYELTDVLQLLAEHVIDIMKADGCTINLIEESTRKIIDTVNFSKKDNIEAQMKKKVIFQILKGDDIYYASAREKGFYSLFEKANNVKTVICVPVFIRSLVTGFVQVYYDNIYIYSEKQSKYLSTLAREAAIAIENTRLMGRSALLQESHHRIKNNLQYIISLITLQKDFIKEDNKGIEDVLDNSISRIKSIASVHELLSNNELGRSIINVKEIINVIIEFFKNHKAKIISELEDIFIAYEKASAIALIINELINNSLEHAFTGQNNEKIIKVLCKRDQGNIFLTVKDNGVGLPGDFDFERLESLGLTIVHSIVVKQFRGEIDFINDNGTRIKIKLPL